MLIAEYLAKERHAEFLAKAERNRLLVITDTKPIRSNSLSSKLLIWFGGQLRRWGSRLEERFAVGSAPNQSQPVDRGLKV